MPAATAVPFSGGAQDRFAQLADELLAAPKVITFPDGSEGELNYSLLVAITQSYMYFSPDWPELAQLLADFESAPASKRVRVALRRFSRVGLGLAPLVPALLQRARGRAGCVLLGLR